MSAAPVKVVTYPAQPADLIWLLIKKQNAFLVKRSGHVFSTEPNNLNQTHSFKYSGLAQPKVLGVVSGPDNKGVKIVVQKKKLATKPSKRVSATVIRGGARKAVKTLAGLSKSGYRGNLQKAALARVSAIIAAQKPKKTIKVGRIAKK